MDAIYIKATEITPEIILDKEKNIFKFKGRSLPEEVIDFYQPILKWLEEYISNPNNQTIIEMDFDYLNSASQKMLSNIFELLEQLKKNGNDIKIKWKYNIDDNELKEIGQEFSEIFSIPFELEGYFSN